MENKKYYIIIYSYDKYNDNSVWWIQLTNESIAHSYAILCKTYLENRFVIKVTNKLENYKGYKLIKLSENYIYNVISSIKNGKFVKGLI